MRIVEFEPVVASSVPWGCIITTWDLFTAVSTSILIELISAQLVPISLNQTGFALGTIGAVPLFIVHIPHINVTQTGSNRDVVRCDQRFNRRIRPILHTEVRCERRHEMGRYVRSDCIDNPIAHLLYLHLVIIELRDDQVGNLKPNVRLLFEIDERVEHRLQVRVSDLRIELFGKPLQVDIGGIHMLKELWPSLLANVARGDRYTLNAKLLAGDCRIDGIFSPDDGIVVGEGNALAAELMGSAGNCFRSCI